MKRFKDSTTSKMFKANGGGQCGSGTHFDPQTGKCVMTPFREGAGGSSTTRPKVKKRNWSVVNPGKKS